MVAGWLDVQLICSVNVQGSASASVVLDNPVLDTSLRLLQRPRASRRKLGRHTTRSKSMPVQRASPMMRHSTLPEVWTQTMRTHGRDQAQRHLARTAKNATPAASAATASTPLADDILWWCCDVAASSRCSSCVCCCCSCCFSCMSCSSISCCVS